MKISVIIANRNDLAMLGITVRSALEELSAIDGGGEIVIVDNSDEKYREAVKAIIPARYLDNEVRLFYQNYPCLFTAREEAARRALGEYIFCVDSHCLFGRDSIKNAVDFMDSHTGPLYPLGFGNIPVNWLCQHPQSSKHDMKFIHGTWGKLYENEQKISWKGMPWICCRDWFLNELGGYGALSEHKLAWGGGDMYLGLKTWLLGFENWSITARPVIHIGPFPKVARQFIKYRVYKESGKQFSTFGWLVAFYALGTHDDYFDRPEIESFLKNRIAENFKDHLPKAKQLAESDRKWIAQKSKRTFYDLYKNPPWNNKESISEYIDFEPFYNRYKKRLNVAKALRPEDWYMFQGLVRQYNVKNVVEFGSGLSTLLWQALDLRVTSFETDINFMNKIAEFCNGSVFFLNWNNKVVPKNIGPADWSAGLAFVDGIDPRDKQIEIAKHCAPVIIVHDGYTPPTPGFIKEMLADWQEIKVESVRSRLFLKRKRNHA